MPPTNGPQKSLQTVSAAVIHEFTRSRPGGETAIGTSAVAAVSALPISTPSTRPAAYSSGIEAAPTCTAKSSAVTAVTRMPLAATISRRRSRRSTMAPICSAVSSHGSVRVSATPVTCSGDCVSRMASSGSTILVTPSARLVTAVNTMSTTELRRSVAAARCPPAADCAWDVGGAARSVVPCTSDGAARSLGSAVIAPPRSASPCWSSGTRRPSTAAAAAVTDVPHGGVVETLGHGRAPLPLAVSRASWMGVVRPHSTGEEGGRMSDDAIEVVIEIPKGSRNKYEFDHQRQVLRLDRRLFSATVYPADYGFIEGTLAEDGDPLDALVLMIAFLAVRPRELVAPLPYKLYGSKAS